ncbi:MAG: PAS domain S-box protein [Desulfovermiculus sp.]|nr:PAS domain S-box protein [Desulfovermiculus sp.]
MDELFPTLLARGFQEEIVLLSPDLIVQYANERFLSAHALDQNQVHNIPCHLILENCRRFCEEFVDECPVHKAMSIGGPTTATLRDVNQGKEIRHFKIHIYPVELEGHGRFYLHITRDITDRIEQERLRENMWMEILQQMEDLYNKMVQEGNKLDRLEHRFEHLKDSAPLALVAWDQEGLVRQWSLNAEIHLGWPAAEALGQPFVHFFASGASQKRIEQIVQDITQGQELDYSVNENRTASGDIIVCEWYHSAFFLDEGQSMRGGMSMGQDITENVITAQALHRMEAQTEALLRAVDDALVGVNHLGRITFWNQAAERLFGWTAESAIGREIEILLPAQAVLEQGPSLRRFFTDPGGESTRKKILETQAVQRDGTFFPARLSMFSARLEEQHMGILVVRDVSEIKRMERLLSQSEKMRSLGEMASGVGHDVNNYLTVVLGNLELLKGSLSQKADMDLIESVEQAARRGVQRTAELQAFVQGDAGSKEGEWELTHVDRLVREVVNLTRFRWKDQTERTGHTIDVAIDIQELPPVMLRASDFRELLTNLVLNAVEAMPQGGRLHISGRPEGNGVRIKVQDNGLGMSSREQTRVFEPFFTTKGPTHAGMGLTIARNVARRHSGELSIKSIKGSGTTVSLFLPTDSVSSKGPELVGNKAYSLSILLIEDEEPVRDMLRRFLERAGHKVQEAHNGREGVDMFRRGQFDVVVTDHGMPEMNGEEAALRIKKFDPDMPVILMSGWAGDLDRDKPISGLIEEFIPKPIDFERLLATVHRLAGSRRGK